MVEIKVKHIENEHKFVIDIEQEQAVLIYEIYDDRVNFSSTFVPDTLRGQGLAEKLVRFGLRWASSANLKVEASCWYVQKFLSPKHQ
ncbi:GNAT family N-acetyltransferase [Shewanella sp. UCD-KL12]|uniref:GNAT family N-acetyltransferase n=1 Tax=Shewanella sp. UCD-KL12 TaxID=1917163 RepID=UPI00097109A7|nr:GNAT family N-acetyltransferase [Shewanella sp. UCD-KL12]